MEGRNLRKCSVRERRQTSKLKLATLELRRGGASSHDPCVLPDFQSLSASTAYGLAMSMGRWGKLVAPEMASSKRGHCPERLSEGNALTVAICLEGHTRPPAAGIGPCRNHSIFHCPSSNACIEFVSRRAQPYGWPPPNGVPPGWRSTLTKPTLRLQLLERHA